MLSVLFVIEILDGHFTIDQEMLFFLAQQFWFFTTWFILQKERSCLLLNDFKFSCCFHVFLNNFFVPYGWTLNRVGVKFLTSNQLQSTQVRSTRGTMSLDGSPKAKTVYRQSSEILFKQKWGIHYPKFTVLVHFWLGKIYPLS